MRVSFRDHSADSHILDNVLDNERLQVDFTPLYQCIHIYGALDALDEIRKSYQADRKVGLILCFLEYPVTTASQMQ